MARPGACRALRQAFRAFASAPAAEIAASRKRKLPADLPDLRAFQLQARSKIVPATSDFAETEHLQLHGMVYNVETYGCQMNEEDSNIVQGVLASAGLRRGDAQSADFHLINTCAIREHAEQKVFDRLRGLRNSSRLVRKDQRPTIVVLGCMAERLKGRLLDGQERLADVVVGPDGYRDLPRLLAAVHGGVADSAMNVQLSLEETYADIAPVRDMPAAAGPQAVGAFLSIMRGCNNMCSFCVVPHTRGRERSRPVESIMAEVGNLVEKGYREVTLLGQNVNSFCDSAAQPSERYSERGYVAADGFQNMYKARDGAGVRFAELLDRLSEAFPDTRFRFTSAHPKDFPPDLLHLIAERPNLAKQLHLPAQAGSDTVLARMRRGYTVSAYETLALSARELIPDVTLSSDFITGFCGETEEEHAGTIALMKRMQYEQAFMFAYSLRERTHAAYTYSDDVPQVVKQERLQEVIQTFRAGAAQRNKLEVGKLHLVLVEGPSKRSRGARGEGDSPVLSHSPTQLSPEDSSSLGVEWTGRTCGNKRAMLQQAVVAACLEDYLCGQPSPGRPLRPGDFVACRVVSVGVSTLHVQPLAITGIQSFARLHRKLQQKEAQMHSQQ